jgi:outer membrane protein assembly factor BamB
MLSRRLGWIAGPIGIGAFWIACGGSSGTSKKGDGGPDSTTPTSDSGVSGFEAGQGSDAAVTESGAAEAGSSVGASVLEHHLHPTRDGAYTDVNVTTAAAAAAHVDTGFTATVTGTIYGQPLYVDGWQTGTDAVFVATNENHVTALNATSGAVLWDVTLGPPVPQSSLPCGQPYTTYGVMETPVIDLLSRTLYVESFQTVGGVIGHYVYALSIDTGATQTGWPVNVVTSVPGFTANTQNDRGGLTILNGTLYVPYAGLNGDCGSYHGWVVGISTTNPATVGSYSTAASQGGIWGAVASDGTSLYAVTGNTGGAMNWGGGEALIRFTAGPKFSGATTDYFTPSNWSTLDRYDGDLGSASAVLFDLPGATPSTLAVAAGKWGVAHLLNRAALGGIGTGNGTIGEGISSVVFAAVQNQESPPGSKGTPASYTTAKGRYVVLHSESNITAAACPTGSGDLVALSVTATSPPTLVPAWCANSGGKGSPIATTTDGTSNALVWIVSTGGTNSLLAFDGDTGAAMATVAPPAGATVQHWTSPIVAKGRFIVGGTNAVYAFTTQ